MRHFMAKRYFAYASNMHPGEMSRHCGGSRLLGPARLPDHRLAFTRKSVRNYPGSGVADLLPDVGHTVWGALYEVSDQDLEGLNRKEASGQAYEQVSVRVLGSDERLVDAIAYTVIEKAEPELLPSSLYLGHIVEGARACELPDDYLTFLESLGVKSFDPA